MYIHTVDVVVVVVVDGVVRRVWCGGFSLPFCLVIFHLVGLFATFVCSVCD